MGRVQSVILTNVRIFYEFDFQSNHKVAVKGSSIETYSRFNWSLIWILFSLSRFVWMLISFHRKRIGLVCLESRSLCRARHKQDNAICIKESGSKWRGCLVHRLLEKRTVKMGRWRKIEYSVVLWRMVGEETWSKVIRKAVRRGARREVEYQTIKTARTGELKTNVNYFVLKYLSPCQP